MSGRRNSIPRLEAYTPNAIVIVETRSTLSFECSALSDIRQETQLLLHGTFDMRSFMNQQNEYALVVSVCQYLARDDGLLDTPMSG